MPHGKFLRAHQQQEWRGIPMSGLDLLRNLLCILNSRSHQVHNIPHPNISQGIWGQVQEPA